MASVDAASYGRPSLSNVVLKMRPGAALEVPEPLASSLPSELVELLSTTDGGYASTEDYYIDLLPLGEMVRLNSTNGAALQAAQLVVFGTNGADEAYAASVAAEDSGAIYMVPLTSICREDAAFVASSFSEFRSGRGVPEGW